MNSETIIYCVFAVILGMLVFHMLKNVCGCKTVEGLSNCILDGTPIKSGDVGRYKSICQESGTCDWIDGMNAGTTIISPEANYCAFMVEPSDLPKGGAQGDGGWDYYKSGFWGDKCEHILDETCLDYATRTAGGGALKCSSDIESGTCEVVDVNNNKKQPKDCTKETPCLIKDQLGFINKVACWTDRIGNTESACYIISKTTGTGLASAAAEASPETQGPGKN